MSTISTNQKNGLRTFRPELSGYVYSTEKLQSLTYKWLQGVIDGTAIRALLLSGPAGLGKTTLALALCKHLGAVDNDIQEVNCATTRTLEDARELTSRLNYNPAFGAYRVLLLDEVHQMVQNAQQAFLTPIETLPPKTLLIACTSNPESLNAAFRSRFYEIRLEAYPEEKIVQILKGLPKPPPEEEIPRIATLAGGNPRRAISLAEGGMGIENQTDLLKIQGIDAAYGLLMRHDYLNLLLILTQITEQDKAAFFGKVLPLLEHTWVVKATGSLDRVPLVDKERITVAIKEAGTQLTLEWLAYLYESFAAVQYKSIQEIKAVVMKLYRQVYPGTK